MIATVAAACDRANPPSVSLDTPNDALPSEGPPPPPDGAFLAQMSPEQTNQLTSLGVEVVVPGTVPPSFAIAELRVDRGDSGPAYLVVYQNDLNQCFAVEFAAQGIDDPPATESRTPIQPPLFGDQDYGLNHGPFADADMRAQFPQPNLFTDWMSGPSGAYRLIGATYIGDLFESLRSCADVPIPEAVALAESLTVLTADPMGDLLESKP
ncbi:hypothetical protein IQ254_06055 [Nodosilinea sp. LEGE 07088]|uniref:hypothetical protein n=1 Tax=Nodosilinea sp. LEGE 07088 TaxID=2777968 RepID=UPI001881FC0F|nr:hypothetical protein [Nodosilinea sp. LEGE 07088]MBE9136770.1 hypothetical protein [Nodosilinea sp. LEGE 07088]